MEGPSNFYIPQTFHNVMARLSSANPPPAPPDPTAINLTRMLARLQGILITPDSDTESRLRASSLERERVGTNLEYARSLLSRLEQDAQNIKVQARKQDTQTDLVRKRETIQRLAERLQELNELGDEEDNSSEGEDLLGEDTPSEETDSHTSHISPESATPSPPGAITPPLSAVPLSSPQISQPPPPESTITPPTTTTTTELRARNPTTTALRAELLTPAATSTGISTATTEALLTHNRTEQESLTSSLLNMASALKASSQAFSSSLESEKTVLDSATSGLDKNELGLEAAQRRMGLLRRMSEGKGWWGRMVMYAWIALLMVIALIIVFVLPKFRF